MLLGTYDHNIDKKGRISIPSKLRGFLGEEFIICKGIYGKRCLCVYSLAEWEKLVEKIDTLPNSKASEVKRFLYGGAFTIEFDTQGRILIPPTLREYAELNENAYIIGVTSNLEIWNRELYSKENELSTPEYIGSITNELNF